MKTPQLVGLTGAAGCGKDVSARILVAEYGYEHYAFAQPIKAALSAILGVPVSMMEDRNYKDVPVSWIGKSPREMLQTLGTEWGREIIHPDIWVRLMRRRWELVQNLSLPGMVVSDVRFDNEADTIRRMGGVVVKLVRPQAAPVASHKSENGVSIDLVDFTILNTGTFSELREAVMAVPSIKPRYRP